MSKLLDARNKALDDINAGKTVKKIRDQESELESLRQQLAECQATNGKLRSDMSLFLDSHEECEDFDGFTAQIVSMDDYHKAQEALALPNDATVLNELIAERTKELERMLEFTSEQHRSVLKSHDELTAEVERQREQLFHIVKECDASATQSKRILRIKSRAESTLSGAAPDFSSVKDRREDKIRHIGQLNYLNDQLRQQNAKLTAQRDAAMKDAERWRTIELLMFLGNVELNQDEDGGYSIGLDPVEKIVAQRWEGDSPEEAIDAAIANCKEPGV